MASFHGNYQPPWMFAQGVTPQPTNGNVYGSANQWGQTPQAPTAAAAGATWNYLSGMPSANPSLPQTDVYAQGGQYYPPAQPSYQRLRPNQRYVTLPQSQVQQHPQHQEYTQVAPVQSMQQHFMAARHEETYQSPTMEPMIFAYQQQNQNSFANEDSLTIGVDIALTKNLTNQTSEMKLPSQSHHHVTENLSSQPTDPEPPKFADTNKCSSTDNCFVPPTYHDFASVEVPNPLPDMSPANQPGITSAQSDILDESQWNDDGWACDQPEENGGPVVTYFGGNDLVAHLSASEEVSVAATEENSAASREEMEAGSERHYLGMGGAPDVVSDSQYAADSCDYYQEREVDEMPNFGQPIVDHSNLGQPQSNSGNPPDLWQAYQTGSTADSDVANGNIYASGYPPPDIVEKQMDEEAHRPAARQSSENQNWSMEDVVLDDSNGPASESLLEQSEQQPSLVQHFTSAVGQRIQGIASVFTQGSSSSVDHCEADEHIEPRHVRSESQTLQETAGEAPQLSFGYRSAQETIRPPVIPFNGNSQVNFRSLTPSSSSPFVQPVMPVPQTNPPASAARSTKRPANLSVSEIQSYSYFEEQLDLVNQQNDPTVPDRVNLWRSEAAETENRQSDQNQNFAPSEHPLPPSNLSVCSRDRLSQDRSDLDATPLEMRDVDWNSLNQQLRSYALSSEQIPEVEIPPQNLDSVLNAATSDRQIHQISLPTEESVNDLQVTEDVADIICHEESPDAPDQIQSALENNWVDENELKDVESDRWSDNWSTAPQMDTQSVMRVSDSVDNNLSRLEEQQTNEESHQNDWGENDEEEENLVISEGLEEVRNFPVLTDTIEEPPGDNWSIVPEFDDQSVANLTTACPSVASNLNQLDSESGSAHESLQRETDSHSTIMSVVESSFSGPTEDFNGVARRDTQRGNDDWSTMSQAGDRSVIPQLDSIGSNMEKLDSDSWVSWEQTGNPVERLAEAIGYSGVQQFTKEEDEDKEWQEELRTVRSDSISSGAGVGRREAIQRHAASHQNFVRDATEATDHSVPPEDPISENLWISQVPDVAPKPLTLSETSVETEVVAAEQESSVSFINKIPDVSEASTTCTNIKEVGDIRSHPKRQVSKMAEKPKSETTNVPPTSQELPPQRANSTRMTGDPQRRYREKVEKNQEYQEIISKRKSRIEAARSVSAATTSLLSPLRDFGVGSSAPPMGLLIAPASVGSSMVSTPQMGSPVPREDRQRHRENGVEQPPPPQSILKTDGRTRHPEMASSPTDSSLERENLEEIQPRTTAAPITRTNSTPKDESFETAARYNDAQLGAATGRNRRKELTPDVSVITAESKLGVTRSKSYGVNETNRTRLANREEYEDRDYDYDAPMPPRRTYDDPSLVDAERYRVDPYQQPRRPRHGSEYGYEAPVQRSHSRSSIHSAYDERDAIPRNRQRYMNNSYRDYDHGQRRQLYDYGRPRPSSARDPRGFTNEMDQSEDDEYSEDEELRSLHRWQGEHRQYYRPPTDSLDRELQLWELDRLIQMDPSWNYLIGEFRLTHRGRGPTRRELTAMWQQSQNQILMQEKARMAAAAALARTTAATRHIPPPPSTTGGQTEAQAAARAAYVAQQKHLFSDDSIRTNSRPLANERLSDNSIDAQSEISDLRPEPNAPHKFITPHCVCRFSPSGALVILNGSSRAGVAPTTVEIRNFKDQISETAAKANLEELRSFPGPLIRTGLNKALIRNFIQHKLDELRKLKSHPSGDLDGLLLLWKFLQSLVITGGNVSRSDVALLLSEDFIVHAEEAKVEPSIRASKPVTGHYSDQDYSDSEYPDHGYERAELLETGSQTANPAMNHYMGLLMQGEIKDAIDFAVKNNLWEDALSLAYFLGNQVLNSVMMKRIQSMKLNDPRQTLFELKIGRQPLAVTKPPDEDWGDWKPHLAVVVANGNFQSETDVKSLEIMGNTLANCGKVYSAHFCYLMAHFWAGRDVFGNNLMALVGEVISFDDEWPKSVSNTAIQTTEIYEFAIRVKHEQFALLSLQLYKYVYATRLAEMGFTDEALSYCHTLADTILENPHLYSLPMVSRVYELSCSLCQFDPNIEHFLTSVGQSYVVIQQDWILRLKQLLNRPSTGDSTQRDEQQVAKLQQNNFIENQFVSSPRESVAEEVGFSDYSHLAPSREPENVFAPQNNRGLSEPTSPLSQYESVNGDYFEGNFAPPGPAESAEDPDELGNSTASYTQPFPQQHQYPPFSNNRSQQQQQQHRISESSNSPSRDVPTFNYQQTHSDQIPRIRHDSIPPAPQTPKLPTRQPDIFDMIAQEKQLKVAEQNDTQFKSPRIPTISVGSPGSDRVFDSPQVEPSQSNRDLKRPEPFRTSQVQPPLGQNQNNSRPHSDGQLDNDKGKVDSNQSGPKRNKSIAEKLGGFIQKFIPPPPGVVAIDKNLPDDKDPGLVWDKEKNCWVDKSTGSETKLPDVAPPPTVPSVQQEAKVETPNGVPTVATFSIGHTVIKKSANRSRYASPTPTSSSVMNGSLDALIPPVAPIASAYFVPEPTQLEPSESLSPFCTSENPMDVSQQPQTPPTSKKPKQSAYFQ